MKGLVLAGGSGRRLRPLTWSGAKQLVPVANRPILFYVLDNLVDAGIRDIGVVVSPATGEEVRSAIGDGARWGARFEFIQQDHPAGLAHAVQIARPFLRDDAFCLFLGDTLVGTMIGPAVERFRQRTEIQASVMLKEVRNPSSFGIAEIDEDGEVTGVAEKPTEPRSNLALAGIYMFRPTVFDAVARIRPSARGELEITDAIGQLISGGHRVGSDRVTSWWLDTGTMEDLLLANETVLSCWLVPAVDGEVDGDSSISGAVRIEKGARVVRSHIDGPVIIGAGATVTDARIGPFTSLGNGVTVERSTLQRCVVLEEARVFDVPRLENSLIGRRVEIGRSSRAGTVTLLVGDDCRLELD